MNQPTTGTPASQPGSNALRFDIVAGLTAAAVVLPKAMAYATVAGLPVAVGLYTAFIPMAIYALLGSSRVLSVSSTTTLAILAGTQLGLAVPDGDPAMLITATATLTALVGAILLAGKAAATGFRRELHFRAGADRLQGRHWPRDRAGPASEAARHPHHEAEFLCRPAQHRPPRSRDVAADTGRGRRDIRDTGRHGAAVAAFSGAAGGRRWRHRRVVVLRIDGARRLDGRPHPAGISFAYAAGPRAGPATVARRARDRADELHRNDRRGPRLRASARSSDRRESRAGRNRRCQPRRSAVRRHAGRRRHFANGGRALRGRADRRRHRW